MKIIPRSYGFTLIEVMVVLFIITLLSPLALPDLRHKAQETKISSLATETGVLSIAVVNSFDDNDVWPGGANCANAVSALTTSVPPYMSDVDSTNVFDNSITTTCTLNEFTITQNVNPSFVQEAAQTLGGTSVIDAAAGTIRTTIPRPGTNAGLQHLLPLDGTRQMLANLNLGGNGLVGASNITASGSITGGSISSSGSVTGRSISSSGSVTGRSISSSGSITGGSISSSGSVTGRSISSSGSVTGRSISSSGSVTGRSISSSGSITGGSISSSGTIRGGTTIWGQVLLDLNNGRYYVDPHATSNFNTSWFARALVNRNPTDPRDLANKRYVDSRASSVRRRAWVYYCRTDRTNVMTEIKPYYRSSYRSSGADDRDTKSTRCYPQYEIAIR